MQRRLRDGLQAADADRFVGRDAELAAVADLLDPATPSRVLYVHGPGGIGKSALARAAGRLAEAAGFAVAAYHTGELPVEVDLVVGRLLTNLPERVLLILDDVDDLGASLMALRTPILDALADDSRVLLAGRQAPDPAWRLEGWDAIVVDLALRPLSDQNAAALLTARGVVDPARQESVIAWAQGSPLALTVAASSPSSPDGVWAAGLEERLVQWLAGRSIDQVPPEVLEIAAVAWAVDARLIAAVLPARPTRDAMRQLEGLSVVQRVGHRAMLHPVLATAIRARLRANTPERHRGLVRRVAEHLAARAALGDIDAIFELAELIEDPAVRQSISARPSATHYADALRPGELERFAVEERFAGNPDWPEIRHWFEALPDAVTVARRRDGSAILVGLFARPDRLGKVASRRAGSVGEVASRMAGSVGEVASRASGSGGELGSRTVGSGGDEWPIAASLRAAFRELSGDPASTVAGIVLFADAVSATDMAEGLRVGNGAALHRLGGNVGMVCVHYPEPNRRPAAIFADLGFRPLDPSITARPVSWVGYGPAGAIGFFESVVLREQGFAPRPGPAGAVLVRADLLVQDQDPDRQARLRAVLNDAFGPGPDDRRLRTVIELAHLGPRRTEQECLDTLHVSRTTWFRLLRQARERVVGTAAVLRSPTVGP